MKKGTKKFLALWLFVFLSSSLVVLIDAEPSWLIWSQTYGGADDEGLVHDVFLVETSDGGYALFGSTYSFGAGKADFWLVKTDGSGNMEWNHTYGGASWDRANSLTQTSDGGFALAGDTDSFGNPDVSDFWLVKTDANGNMEWNQKYGKGNGDIISYDPSMVETSDGGFALAGTTQAPGDQSDFWLVKTDEFGNMEWNQIYGGTDSENHPSLVETSDGGFALFGSVYYSDVSGGDYWLVKTDANGNMEWNKTYGGSQHDVAYSLVQTSDGGYALAGDTHSFGAGDADFWLIKTDANGNMEWDRTYGETEGDVALSLIETSDGGFALAGETSSFGAGSFDFWLVKTDGLGHIEWSRTYGGTNYDSANSLVQTSDGGYVLAGTTESFGAGELDFWLVKINEQGIPEFPSWIILPLFVTATLVVIIYRKKLTKKGCPSPDSVFLTASS